MTIRTFWAVSFASGLLAGAASLQGCAAAGADAATPCADVSGTYRSTPDGQSDSLVALLLGAELRGAATTRLVNGASSLQIDSSPVHRLLQMPADYRCEADGAIALLRRDTARISLPPLNNQQVTRSYVLRRDASGDLLLNVYSQTVAAPYGIRLTGPVQLDKTVRWQLQAGG